MLVQGFAPHPAIESFHEAILHRLAGGDAGPLELAIFLPFQVRIARQICPVVADQRTFEAVQCALIGLVGRDCVVSGSLGSQICQNPGEYSPFVDTLGPMALIH